MNKTPLVSIIVPVYNVEKYLERCIESILKQSLKEIEIILIDDDSPDNCGKICDKYAELDNRVKVIHKENAGCSAARNLGIELSRGNYIGFVDSDDYIDENMYKEMYELASKNNLDCVIVGFQKIDSKLLKKEEFLPSEKEIFPSVCTKIFKKELLEKNKIKFLEVRHVS